MHAQVLYQFPVLVPQRILPRAWLLEDREKGYLVVAYVSHKVTSTPVSCSISWHLFGLETRTSLKEFRTPQLPVDIEALCIAYDPAPATQTIGSLEFRDDTSSFHVVVRTIQKEQTALSNPLFDDPANDMAPIGPIYGLWAEGQHWTLLYRKPDIDCVSTPGVCLAHIDRTREQMEVSEVDFAESVLACHHDDTSLILALVPCSEVSGAENAVFTGATHFWGFSATGYSGDFSTEKWRRDLPLRLATGRSTVLTGATDFEWLGINAAAIAGPSAVETGRHTFVMGITMMDIFNRTGYGHTSAEASRIANKVETLICIDTHGEVAQTCADAIGLRVQLALVQSTVVGVDLLDGQWRLWNWEPLAVSTLKKRIELDQRTLRAHVVVAMEQEKSFFWLIEEESGQITITRRDAETLAHITPMVNLPGVHLLAPQRGSGSLDWYTEVEAMAYQNTLLLLAVDSHEQLTLYQVK